MGSLRSKSSIFLPALPIHLQLIISTLTCPGGTCTYVHHVLEQLRYCSEMIAPLYLHMRRGGSIRAGKGMNLEPTRPGRMKTTPPTAIQTGMVTLFRTA
ncbi:hypothetical protein V2G26_000293 [Clonostachys chloroleuca]